RDAVTDYVRDPSLPDQATQLRRDLQRFLPARETPAPVPSADEFAPNAARSQRLDQGTVVQQRHSQLVRGKAGMVDVPKDGDLAAPDFPETTGDQASNHVLPLHADVIP